MRFVATHYCYYIFSHEEVYGEWMSAFVRACVCALSVSMPNTKTKPKQYNKHFHSYTHVVWARRTERERDGQLITLIAIIYCESIAASCLDVVRRSLLLYSCVCVCLCVCVSNFFRFVVFMVNFEPGLTKCNQTLWLAHKQINQNL